LEKKNLLICILICALSVSLVFNVLLYTDRLDLNQQLKEKDELNQSLSDQLSVALDEIGQLKEPRLYTIDLKWTFHKTDIIEGYVDVSGIVFNAGFYEAPIVEAVFTLYNGESIIGSVKDDSIIIMKIPAEGYVHFSHRIYVWALNVTHVSVTYHKLW